MKNRKNYKNSLRVLYTLLFGAIISFALAIPVFADNHQLEIIGGPIIVKSDKENANRTITHLILRNNGTEIKTLVFHAYNVNGETIKLSVINGGPGISAYSVAQFEIDFTDVSTKKITGQLIVQADGIEPASEAITIEPSVINAPALFRIDLLDTSQIIYLSFYFGFLFVAIISLGVILRKFKTQKKFGVLQSLQCRIKGLKWDFKENWASTFVAVGGILATIVGSDIMPASPVIISKQGFQTLNILFPILIALAPFLLATINVLGKEPTKKDGTLIVDEAGKTPLLITPFVIGSAVVTWAVVGELLTLAILFQELLIAGYISAIVAQVSQVFLAAIGLLSINYAVKKTVQISLCAKTLDELKNLADASGIVKAARGTERPEYPVYLP